MPLPPIDNHRNAVSEWTVPWSDSGTDTARTNGHAGASPCLSGNGIPLRVEQSRFAAVK